MLTEDLVSPRARTRILLVDDEPMVRALMRRSLSDCGFTVDEAEDGMTAVERVSAQPDAYALVVMDVVMPRMWGDEAARVIRTKSAGIKIVFVSGAVLDFPAQFFVQSGAADQFLSKPFRHDTLRELVLALLPKTEAGSSSATECRDESE